MKIKLKNIIIFILIYALFFSSGIFGFVGKTEQTQRENFYGISKTPQQYKIKVIDSINEIPVKVVANTSLQNSVNFTDCRFSSVMENKNYFQDQGNFDLNQPSRCFNLGIKPAHYVAQSLEVNNLNQLKTSIIIIELPSSFFSFSLRSFPLSTDDVSALLVNYFVIYFGQNWGSGIRTVPYKARPIASKMLSSKSLIELQNFRC